MMIIVRKEKRKKWKGHRGGSRYRRVYRSRYDRQVLDPPSWPCSSTLPLLWSFSLLCSLVQCAHSLLSPLRASFPLVPLFFFFFFLKLFFKNTLLFLNFDFHPLNLKWKLKFNALKFLKVISFALLFDYTLSQDLHGWYQLIISVFFFFFFFQSFPVFRDDFIYRTYIPVWVKMGN